MMGMNRKRRQAGAAIGGRQQATKGALWFGAAGQGVRPAAVGAAVPAGSRIHTKSNNRAKSKPAAAIERGAAYSTRYYLWSLLISGWLFAVFASLTRGQMPEIFVAVFLTGILLQGLLPAVAARMARLEMSRELSTVEALAGGELKVTVAIRSRIPLPLLWVSVQETLANDCGAEARTVYFRHITLPWGSPAWRIQYTVRGLERGEYRFRPMEAVFGDMLGLTAVRRSIKGSADHRPGNGKSANSAPSFLVLPSWHGPVAAPSYGGRTAPVQESEHGGDGQSAHSGRMARSKHRQTAADRGGTQRMPYRPGDDARRIDWRAAARRGAWLTKKEWTSRPPELLVAIDTLLSSYNGDDRLFDCAAGYTAELVRQAAAERVPFRLLGVEHSQDSHSRNAAGSRRSHEREALERLARMRPLAAAASGEAAAWSNSDNRFPRGATIIVVTAEWRNGALGERLAALAAANGCRPEVHVLTPNKVPSIAMRERKRDWECAGIRVVWTVISDGEASLGKGAAAEGGDANDGAGG